MAQNMVRLRTSIKMNPEDLPLIGEHNYNRNNYG